MKSRLLWLAVVFVLWVDLAHAQFRPITKVLHANETGNVAGETIPIDGASSVSVTVTISGTATVLFEATQDQATWSPVACIQVGDATYASITDTTATMTVRCNVAGLVLFRAQTTGNSGTVSVTATASPGVMGSGGGGAGGGAASWPLSAIEKMVSWANSFLNALKIGNGTDYWAIGHDPTDGLFLDPVCSGVRNGCNFVRKLVAGFYWEIQNASGTSIFRVTNNTGAITNATIDGEGTGNTITLTEEQWFNVVSCQNTTASHIHDTPTTNIPEALCDTGTNTQKGYAAFDATTDESIRGHWVLPTGFTGAIDIKGKYKIATTTGAVGWCFQMVRVPDGATSDPVLPAQAAGNCTSDTVKGTTLQENDFTITGATCTSCVAGDHVYWSLSRDANGGAVTDDAAGDAFLQAFGRVWRVAH